MEATAAGRAAEARGGGAGTVRTGIAAGVLGGLAMAAWMAASAALEGAGPLAPLWPLADAFARGPGAERSAATLLLGVALHLAFSAAVGVVLAAAVPRDFGPVPAGVVCAGGALLVMAVMTTVVLPAVNPTMRAEMPAFGGAWVIAHAVYGLTVGAAAQLVRHRARLGAARALRERHA
ncbi:MAG TPA: hypothetical protein VFL83_14410 [Anaeromyxobacter sp.]|nr:hypothetical protein [Anaeromyxobacter sp.]